ncbi:MAG TPA: hypothetical protein VF228_10855 [Iamia sp.]
MNRPSTLRRPARLRIERGPFLILHLLLVVTAILWFPLGCRDSIGVSSVLPALRPMLQVTPTGAVVTAGHTGDRRLSPAAIVIPALLAAAAVVAARRPSTRPAADDHALRLHLVLGGLRSRAPPLAA